MAWRKVIPEGRDRMQSAVLVWCVVPILSLAYLFVLTIAVGGSGEISWLLFKSVTISVLFALIVWKLRAATGFAAICGGLIAFVVMYAGGLDANGSVIHSGLLPLIALFVLTFASTRAGRARKVAADIAESRRGRNAAQVIANLGAAGLVCCFALRKSGEWWGVLTLAALCEATADTVSSEIGQAFGGQPFLLTSFRRVEAGTDGAVSLLGTLAGVVGAAIVAGAGMWGLRIGSVEAGMALAGGVAGLVFDSVLGATVERKGWLGNDLVNFSSTLFAVGVALGLMVLVR